MSEAQREIEFAIELFVRGHCVGRSRTHPYEATRVESVWVMRDARRKNARDYRKEEWIARISAARHGRVLRPATGANSEGREPGAHRAAVHAGACRAAGQADPEASADGRVAHRQGALPAIR